MVSLRWLAIVMVSLLCREIAGCEPSLPWAVAWSSALGLSLGFGLLVKSFALASLRQDLTSSVQRGLVAQSFQQRRRLAEVLWCFFLPAALLASGWATWFNRLEQDGLPRTLAVLGCFLPSLFLVLLVEVTAAQLDAILDQCEEGYRTDSAEGWLEPFPDSSALG